MLYSLENSKAEDGWKRRAKMLGLPLPEVVLKKPKLVSGLEFYYESFWKLSSSRGYSEFPRQISWRDTIFLCEYYGLDFDETEQFVFIIESMDSVFLDFKAKQYESSKNLSNDKEQSPKG